MDFRIVVQVVVHHGLAVTGFTLGEAGDTQGVGNHLNLAVSLPDQFVGGQCQV